MPNSPIYGKIVPLDNMTDIERRHADARFCPKARSFCGGVRVGAGAAARRSYTNLSQVAKRGVLRLKQRGISNIVVTDDEPARRPSGRGRRENRLKWACEPVFLCPSVFRICSTDSVEKCVSETIEAA